MPTEAYSGSVKLPSGLTPAGTTSVFARACSMRPAPRSKVLQVQHQRTRQRQVSTEVDQSRSSRRIPEREDLRRYFNYPPRLVWSAELEKAAFPRVRDDGYSMQQVDMLLRQLDEALDGSRGLADLIEKATFRYSKKGYSRDHVDWFLDELLMREQTQLGEDTDPWAQFEVADKYRPTSGAGADPKSPADASAAVMKQAREEMEDEWSRFDDQTGNQLSFRARATQSFHALHGRRGSAGHGKKSVLAHEEPAGRPPHYDREDLYAQVSRAPKQAGPTQP